MIIALSFSLLGLIVGSFLNVLVVRHGVRSVRGRSACMTCGAQLMWFDMIPVFSWLILRGSCRHCRARISVQYPLVEAVTGLLFALIGYSIPLTTYPEVLLPVIVYLTIAGLLIAIAAYDFRHTIIPDAWVYSFSTLALASSALNTFPISGGALLGLLSAGPIAASPLLALWLVSRGRWMGLGDVKLALGIGWLLGPTLGIVAVFFAFIIGALVSVPLVFFSSEWWRNFIGGFTPTRISQRLVWGFTMRSEIPFGPFLIFSCIIIWLILLYRLDLNHGFGPLLLLNFLS